MEKANSRQLTAVEILELYRGTLERFNTQLIKLTENSSEEVVTQYLDIIEGHMAKAEEFLLEEALVEFTDTESEEVRICVVPRGIEFHPQKGGLLISGIPIWLLGNISHRKSPTSYHRVRPWVRRTTWLKALMKHLKYEYLKSVWRHESLLPGVDEVPNYAHVTLNFRVTSNHVRDLDHYSVSSLINALVSNGLLLSDHPERLTYTTIWNDERVTDLVDVHVEYFESKPLCFVNKT